MKLPFRKPKENKGQSEETLQTLQQSFNQVLFELGDLNYRKNMIKQELTKIDSEINSRIQKADAMGVRANALRLRAQAEVQAKVEEGKAKEQSNEAASEAP